ncbi:MAG: K+-sensing histidine kinase KdpD [Patiriisocius sp.]|jgi:K+-sensing histidine kinase KdpD
MDNNNTSKIQDNDKIISESFDFSSVIAVAIHDMKNSLSLLMQSIEQLATQIPAKNTQAREGINSVHYEANRMNTTLVQVLSLYRSDLDALPVNIDECFLIDLIEEVVESNRTYIDQKDLCVTIDVHQDLCWYLDRELIYLLVHDVLINAIRYGCDHIELSAKEIDGKLHISVIDDGSGYPTSMLEMATVKLNNFCISEGRTGLGLFFARLIAQTHKNNGSSGYIKLSNDEKTGGSVFELSLP